MGIWYPGNEERYYLKFLDNRINLALAIEMRNANLDSFRHPGLYEQAPGPQASPLRSTRPPVPRRASGVPARS